MLGPHKLPRLSVLDKMTKPHSWGWAGNESKAGAKAGTQLAALRVGLSPSPCPNRCKEQGDGGKGALSAVNHEGGVIWSCLKGEISLTRQGFLPLTNLAEGI